MERTDRVITANAGDDSLSIIDPAEGIEVDRIKLPSGTGPVALAFGQGSSELVIAQTYDNSVVRYNLFRKKIEKTIYVGCRPGCIAICSREGKVYVANEDSDCVSIIDEENFELSGQINTGCMPCGIDCHPYKPMVAVANMNSGDVWIFETCSYNIIARIKTSGCPSSVKFSKKGKCLYVACCFIDHVGYVTVIDVNKNIVLEEIPVDAVPACLYEAEKGDFLLVASAGEGTLDVVDLASGRVVQRIKIGRMACGVAVDAGEVYGFVTNPDTSTVSIIELVTGKKIFDIPVGKEPYGIIYLHGNI